MGLEHETPLFKLNVKVVVVFCFYDIIVFKEV